MKKYLLFIFSLIFVTLYLIDTIESSEYHDYLVVGAGPSGLQMGSFLSEKKRDYLILEKGNSSGTFFEKFPRHNTLISINKRNTGKKNREFNLRHDWNSLITDDETLQFKEYTKAFFPDKSDYIKYLKDFTGKLHLKVRFNTNIVSSRKINDNLIELKDENSKVFTCKYLIISTGLFMPNKVSFVGNEHVTYYDEMEIDPNHYEGKNILILGKGNTAYEVANSLFPFANFVHMGSRGRVRLSWATHYVGDLRAINNNLLDNYQLKSLDGVFEGSVEELVVNKTEEGRLKVTNVYRHGELNDNFAIREDYDYIISCLGWRWDNSPWAGLNLKENIGKLRKFPKIDHFYEAESVPNVFFTGVLTHSLDFRKSAGGFIHGYRYTTRALHKLLERRNHGVVWPHLPAQPYTQLVTYAIKRVNEASGPYQMFQALGDVIVLNDEDETFEVFEEFPLSGLDEFSERSGRETKKAIVIVWEYGEGFSGAENDPFRYNRSTGAIDEAHMSNFLHPVFYYFNGLPTKPEMIAQSMIDKLKLPAPNRIHPIVEDFLTFFDGRNSHIIPLRRFFETVIGTDLRTFSQEDCLYEAFIGDSLPYDCRNSYLKNFDSVTM